TSSLFCRSLVRLPFFPKNRIMLVWPEKPDLDYKHLIGNSSYALPQDRQRGRSDVYVSNVVGRDGVVSCIKEFGLHLKYIINRQFILVCEHDDQIHVAHACHQANQTCRCAWLQRCSYFRKYRRNASTFVDAVLRAICQPLTGPTSLDIFVQTGTSQKKCTSTVPMLDYVVKLEIFPLRMPDNYKYSRYNCDFSIQNSTKTYKDLYDDLQLGTIRRHVHSFWFNKTIPTLDKILTVIKNDDSLPNISRSNLNNNLLKFMNFVYTKQSRNSALIEKDEIILGRRRYLLNIKKYREEGRHAFVQGLTTGSQNPSGKGKRLIVLHIGSKNGFVPGGLLCFEAKKTNTDNHEEMNVGRKLMVDVDTAARVNKARIHNEETNCGVDNIILGVWNSIPDTFNSVKKLAISLLTIFPSTYAYESIISILNHTLSKARNRLTEEDSAACISLQSTSYQPDLKKLTTYMIIINFSFIFFCVNKNNYGYHMRPFRTMYSDMDSDVVPNINIPRSAYKTTRVKKHNKLMELKLLLLKAFDVHTKRSKKVVVCVHRNAQVDFVPLTKTSSVFDKVSFEIHRSLHVVQA
ncbi:Hypothetical protein CINCED_3A022898, partial [Cinara cedri]